MRTKASRRWITIFILLAVVPSIAMARKKWTYTSTSTCDSGEGWYEYSTTVSCEKSRGRAKAHSLMSAILVSTDGPQPVTVTVVNSKGEPFVVHGTTVELAASDYATNRVTELHPPTDGNTWVGFSSTELLESSDDAETMDFQIIFQMEGQPKNSDPAVIWVGNDGDLRNGDLVIGSGSIATMP